MQLILYEYCIHLHKALRGVGGRGRKEQQQQQVTRATVTAWRIFPKETNQKKKTKSKKESVGYIHEDIFRRKIYSFK